MPGFEWNSDTPKPDPAADATLFPVSYTLDVHAWENDTEGALLENIPAKKWWVYTGLPGGAKFKLENAWQLKDNAVGGKLFKGTDYHFFCSPPGAALETSWLSSQVKEADAQKVNTGDPQGKKLAVKLKLKCVKLPLGRDAKINLPACTLARVYVPSKRGGVLRIVHADSKAQLSLFHPDLKTPYKGFKERDEKCKPTGSAEELKADKQLTVFLKQGEYKWFYVLASKPGKVYAEYYEEAFPREKDDTPFFPYHFYYWPVNQKEPFETKNAVLYRYAKAFGKDADEVVWWEIGGAEAIKDGKAKGHAEVLKKAAVSYYEDKDLGHYRPKQPGWAGHCHNAAPAAMMFKEPDKAGKSHNSVKFSQSELEFIQTEFAGNYIQVGGPNSWSMPKLNLSYWIHYKVKSGTTWTDNVVKNPKGGPLDLTYYFKPADTDPGSKLADLLHTRFKYSEPDYVQMDPAMCQKEADRIFKLFGDKKGFNDHVKKWWIKVGVDFLDGAMKLVGVHGEPALGNIRANQASEDYSPIWNNCLMYVRANFTQRQGSSDEKELTMVNDFYFNIDNAKMIGKPTCNVSKGEIVPKDFWGRRQKLDMKYKDSGDADKGDANNKFTSFSFFMGSPFPGELYMTSYLLAPRLPVATSRNPQDDFGGGNPYIDRVPLDKKIIELRDKYA